MKNNSMFQEYTTEYISGVMSLRSPQKRSLEILDKILEEVPLDPKIPLEEKLKKVNALYPICSDFERAFMSLTFALATGVGKTRLMGAFISYLYTNYGIKHFFVVAPGTTVYHKLIADLGNPNNEKYVFKGLGCFNTPPRVVSGDQYRDGNITLFDSEVTIYIFNIDKFNKEDSKMRSVTEYLGTSFYEMLSQMDDLVLIMDESHHYRASQGWEALNQLDPILGLELTATPLAKVKSKQVPFKNVVYEYPLSKAIEDGYTRTPFAVTRTDINFFNFGEEETDKAMLLDGLLCHEKVKEKLKNYAEVSGKRLVKPFVLVVCKDTDHAQWVLNYIQSEECMDGKYRNKTIVVHSKQKGAETEANMNLLLDVEKSYNPIEIVIHVNMLKEGWDVNNLYTIIPLRTASSKILREQMVGRGLRLPYGERTGEKELDAVMLTAHDKFKEILDEAQKGDSIFKEGNVIKIEELQKEKEITTQLSLFIDEDANKDLEKIGIDPTTANAQKVIEIKKILWQQVEDEVTKKPLQRDTTEERWVAQKAVEETVKKIENDKDLAQIYNDNKDVFSDWFVKEAETICYDMVEKFIPIPQVVVTDNGIEEYKFVDFDLDLSLLQYMPVASDLLEQNLLDQSDAVVVKAAHLDFGAVNPQKTLMEELRKKPELDYEKSGGLMRKLITQFCTTTEAKHGLNGLKNIVMMYKREISKKIYTQLMQHFYYSNGLLEEKVVGVRKQNLKQKYNFYEKRELYSNEKDGNIKSVLYEGIKKGVFSTAKFDSEPELVLARILERDKSVKNWLRPAKEEFNISYNNGKRYEPDFVVETEDHIYLVEVKGEDKLNDPDVQAKKERAILFCSVVTRYNEANGYKPWSYLFIPAGKLLENTTFGNLSQLFIEQ